MNHTPSVFWSLPADQLLQQRETTPEGLKEAEARQRLQRYGPNLLKPARRDDTLTLFFGQFKSPIILILILAAGLSFALQDPVDALIILGIVLVSGLLGYWQEQGEKHLMITKRALSNVLAACSKAETSNGTLVELSQVREQIDHHFKEFSSQGFRVLGVAYREWEPNLVLTKDSEKMLIFLGFLVLFDPPKSGIVETIRQLKSLGVSLKIITGDNHLVAATIGQEMGLSNLNLITGPELQKTSGRALLQKVNEVDIFAEVEPNQKERVILALRKAGNVVGYMGDGLNDVSALQAADVAISVDQAVDVAKEAADIVLLENQILVKI